MTTRRRKSFFKERGEEDYKLSCFGLYDNDNGLRKRRVSEQIPPFSSSSFGKKLPLLEGKEKKGDLSSQVFKKKTEKGLERATSRLIFPFSASITRHASFCAALEAKKVLEGREKRRLELCQKCH